jgi:hypothetical protein
MCILCDHEALELLTAPLGGFQPGRLSEAVRAAREAVRRFVSTRSRN